MPICRDCGVAGPAHAEAADDLMPNTCPACFERRIAPVFARAHSFHELFAGLMAVGCRVEHLATWLRRVAR